MRSLHVQDLLTRRSVTLVRINQEKPHNDKNVLYELRQKPNYRTIAKSTFLPSQNRRIPSSMATTVPVLPIPAEQCTTHGALVLLTSDNNLSGIMAFSWLGMP